MTTGSPPPPDDTLNAPLPQPPFEQRGWQGLSDGAIRTILVIWALSVFTVAIGTVIVAAVVGQPLILVGTGASVVAAVPPLVTLVFRYYFNPSSRRGGSK